MARPLVVPAMVLADSSGWVDEEVDPGAAIQPESAAPGDEQPSIEVLLERIAAERRARQEGLQTIEPAAARKDSVAGKKASKAPSKPRSRVRQTTRSTARPG